MSFASNAFCFGQVCILIPELFFISDIELIQSSHADVLFAPRTSDNILFIQLDRGMTIGNVILLLYAHRLLLFRLKTMPSC